MPAARFRAGRAQPARQHCPRNGEPSLKIALAQVDTRIGDFDGNRRRLAAVVREGARRGADLVVLPELAVPGYPPRDLLLDPAFVDRTLAATADLARDLTGGPPAIVGTLARSGAATPGHPGLWNAAALLSDGTVQAVVAKR
ncbi:MAG TPA: nitrilase-related carbon-nitrogen hydrolase, partial [Thermoanaerobaculia bacterium]|nr:nitrilase-related carbon-nitrogen hydrolase [Thermoanaerobaculia bacterium]